MSYYEKWIAGLVELLLKSGLVTSTEFETGKPVLDSPKTTALLTADKVLPVLAHGRPASRDALVLPRFQVGGKPVELAAGAESLVVAPGSQTGRR